MKNDESPVKIIERLVAAREGATDEQVLAEIAALPPLADERNSCWNSAEYWRSSAYLFLALADVAAQRRLRPAVRLLLERACYGDPGETMRGLRHTFEAIYNPDWHALAEEYLPLARSPRLGTRMWAIECLTVLDDPRAVPVFQASVREDPKDISWVAEMGLDRIANRSAPGAG